MPSLRRVLATATTLGAASTLIGATALAGENRDSSSNQRVALTRLADGSREASRRAFKLRGSIVGDKNSFVKMRVTRLARKRFRISGFSVKRAIGVCNGERDRISLTITGNIPVGGRNRFFRRIEDRNGGVLTLSGHVLRRGRLVRGHIKTNSFDAGGGDTCRVPRKAFRARNILEDPDDA